jgi:hypothetical protein
VFCAGDIATVYGLDDLKSKFESLKVQEFSLLHSVQTGSGAHSASYPMGTSGCYLGEKRLEREADHSPPTSAEINKMWTLRPLPHTPSRCSAYLVKLRNNFTFNLPCFYSCPPSDVWDWNPSATDLATLFMARIGRRKSQYLSPTKKLESFIDYLLDALRHLPFSKKTVSSVVRWHFNPSEHLTSPELPNMRQSTVCEHMNSL